MPRAADVPSRLSAADAIKRVQRRFDNCSRDEAIHWLWQAVERGDCGVTFTPSDCQLALLAEALACGHLPGCPESTTWVNGLKLPPRQRGPIARRFTAAQLRDARKLLAEPEHAGLTRADQAKLLKQRFGMPRKVARTVWEDKREPGWHTPG